MFAYLDNSATTKPCPEAVAAMVEALETGWGNPSSLYRFGMDAARRLKAAREQVAKAPGCRARTGCFSPPVAPRRTIGRWPPLWPEWASGGGM